MNNNLLTIVKAQIVFLLSTLTEDNFERNQLEIRSLSETHGIETYLHFIRRLIAASQVWLTSSAPANTLEATNLSFRLLVQETQRLARDPFLADRFRDAIDRGENDIFKHFDLIRFSDKVGLRPLERLILASSIVSSNCRKELTIQANNIIRNDWTNAILSLCNHPSFDHADLTPAQVAKLLSNLLSDPPADSPILDATQRLELILAAQTKCGPELMGPILRQIFPTMSLPPGTSLVQALNQLGPDLTSDPDTVRALLLRFGVSDASPPTTLQVAEIVATLARNAPEGRMICDVGSLVRALSSFRAPLHWPTIIRAFDSPDRTGVDTATLKLLVAVLLNAPRETDAAVSGFWTVWNNAHWQLRLLDALLSLPNDTFNFVSLPGRRIVTVDDVALASPTIKALAANVQGHTWNSLDLIEILVQLGDSEAQEVRTLVREILDKAVRISAELVHMGLLQVPKPWNTTQYEYSEKLLAMFLAGHPNHQLVFMRIWQIDPKYLTDAFGDFYKESALNITRILDVAQDLKILDSLLEVRPFVFALDVASLASRREYLNLDKWLADNVSNHGIEFLRAVIEFLEGKVDSELTRQDPGAAEPKTMALNPQTIAIFIRMLRSNFNALNQEDLDYFTEIRNKCCQLYPRLMNLTPGSDVEPGLSVVSFSPEVEAEVEGIYKQMYEEQITIDQVIGMLQRSKASSNPREQEIFACCLHSLFDEYKFFQAYYPARELQMTAYLFGSLIQYQLIDYIPLGIAIRYVLDAIRQPPDSNLFKFGVTALARFESRLSKWPDLCRTLLSVQVLLDTRPDLAETCRRVVAQAEAEASGKTNGTALIPEPLALAFTSIRPDPILHETFEDPEEELSDKFLFIINNLAPSNFETKTKEMKERFKDEHARWFANYLVDQRISTEPNNHELYLRFVDSLARKPLFKFLLQESYLKSSVLINNDKTLTSANDRTQLKNLASWIGSLTLARNRPVKFVNISFKDVLLEGYDSNRLIVAIPFICKMLEHCSKSEVFKPPNPWLMAVVSLLAELYYFAELKLNLKFEIEVMCKALDIELDKVEATTILRNRPLTDPLTAPQLPEFVSDMDSLPMNTYDNVSSHPAEQQVAISNITTSSSSSHQSQQALTIQIEAVLQGLPAHVIVSPQLGHFAANPMFKRACQSAVERAVREIILPVVDRSVTIAGISTRELVAKDFALEANEEKMRKAAHLMAQNLAGSLALVTCKEPLRSNMATHVRTVFAEYGFNDKIPDPAVLLIVADNIDVACSTIEKAAMDRAIVEVDELFAGAYSTRRLHREQRPGQPFWDTASNPSHFSSVLPDMLRIKPSGLHFQQMRVYDDFASNAPAGAEPIRQPMSRPGSVLPYPKGNRLTRQTTQSPAPEDASFQGNVLLSQHQAMELFGQLVLQMERTITQTTGGGGATPETIREFLRQVLGVVSQSSERDETALAFSQKTVQLLFKATNQVAREVYVLLLQRLCEASAKVAKEAIEWLLYAEDERKFNVAVTVSLIRARLVNPAEHDSPLSKMVVREFGTAVVQFATNLLHECLFGESPCATKMQYTNTLEALNRAAAANKATPETLTLLDEAGIRRPVLLTDPDTALTDAYDRLAFHFAEWVRIYQRSPSPERSFVPWVTKVTSEGILRGEHLSSLFYRVCVETSIDIYNKHTASGDAAQAYIPIDALSKLIVLMIKYNGDGASATSVPTKVHYLTKILSIVVLVLAKAHEDETKDFQQIPFFRLFSTLLSDLQSIESALHAAYFHLLIALCDTFNTLQPTFFPGFAFSWMTLISHRLFMPKLLLSDNREGWSAFHRLVISLFKFLAPFLRSATLRNAPRHLYRGAIAMLLVLLHDFPEFLSEYYYTICDAIPARCVQLRNVVLSAYPPSFQLPDPYLRDLQLESLPDMGPIPPILSDFSALVPLELRGLLDQHLVLGRGSPSTLQAAKQAISVSIQQPGTLGSGSSGEKYNLSLINAVVMYIGVSSIAQAKTRTGSHLFVATDPGVSLLQQLANELDVEGQHHLLSAIVIHLRYPNAHTHWFSSLILHLFNEVTAEKFQELTTKVLLERFIVHRPHPWGAMVTFIELLRNPRYDFWNKDFIRVAPEITAILDNVRSYLYTGSQSLTASVQQVSRYL